MKNGIACLIIAGVLASCSSTQPRSIASGSSKAMEIKLSAEQAKSLFKLLDKEVPNNAVAKQSHTIGPWIEGPFICREEYPDPDSEVMETSCTITVDTTDKGVGG